MVFVIGNLYSQLLQLLSLPLHHHNHHRLYHRCYCHHHPHHHRCYCQHILIIIDAVVSIILIFIVILFHLEKMALCTLLRTIVYALTFCSFLKFFLYFHLRMFETLRLALVTRCRPKGLDNCR